MNSMFINLVVEDQVSHHILLKIIDAHHFPFEVSAVYGLKGNSYIKRNLHSFNNASKFAPYLVLTDSDRYDCAKKMLDDWINFKINPNFIFSIAVREAETWLLADRENFARFLGVSRDLIPLDPEKISNPKEFLLNLVLRSKQKRIRDEMLYLGRAERGAGYNDALSEFIVDNWNMDEASKRSESLRRLIRRLNLFTRTQSKP